MFSSLDFCIPTRGTKVPHTPNRLHEIKYDGYRLRLERNGDRVRLITKGGYNWSDRYPSSAARSALIYSRPRAEWD
jgi:bifunctional non-homologous end joining protein LigD